MWEVYLLSIIDHAVNVTIVSAIVSVLCGIGLLVLFFYGLDGGDESFQQETDVVKGKIKKVLLIFALTWFFTLFVPTREDLVTSYILVEGSKIATAQNVEKAATAVTGRLDKFLTIVEKKIEK